MHYYSFHIKDYAAATAHLSAEEDLAYRRLLDIYYETERPISNDITLVSRRVRLPEHPVSVVLSEFFVQTQDGWMNSRADDEIGKYKAKLKQASDAGKASAQRRFNGRSTDVQLTNNHKPRTKNQEPFFDI
jgi:uncharacterized protein YdaU (DUF1376 family)